MSQKKLINTAKTIAVVLDDPNDETVNAVLNLPPGRHGERFVEGDFALNNKAWFQAEPTLQVSGTLFLKAAEASTPTQGLSSSGSRSQGRIRRNSRKRRSSRSRPRSATFSADWLLDFLETFHPDVLQVQFGDRLPIHITETIQDKGFASFWLAPRVSD